MASYFLPADEIKGGGERLVSLSPSKPCNEISQQGLQDSGLLPLYQEIAGTSDRSAVMMVQLAKAYLDQGDYRQAFILAQNSLNQLEGGPNDMEAELLNVIGLTYLYSGQDQAAKEAFKKAMQRDPQLGAVRINLAGIYLHYGHQEKASEVSIALDSTQIIHEDVHPRTGAIYNANNLQAR